MSSPSIPPEECSLRSAASLHRVPSGWFPAFTSTISRLRLLELHPAWLRCLHLTVPAVHRCSLQQIAMSFCQPGPFLQRRPRRFPQRERTRPPRFLGNPCQHAPLFDPGGPLATRHDATNDMAFRSENDVGSTHSFISGLYHAACWPPVYASQPGSPPHHATLGSGGWLILTASGLAPAGFQQEVSILVLSFTQISSSSRLGLAHFPRKRFATSIMAFPETAQRLGIPYPHG
jgi:hypothetical protein